MSTTNICHTTSQGRRSKAGVYMLLKTLISVLPKDYMLNIKNKNEVKWRGITWVFLFDKVYEKYNNYAVVSFTTDYYNEEVFVDIIPR